MVSGYCFGVGGTPKNTDDWKFDGVRCHLGREPAERLNDHRQRAANLRGKPDASRAPSTRPKEGDRIRPAATRTAGDSGWCSTSTGANTAVTALAKT